MLASMRKLGVHSRGVDRIDESVPETELQKSQFVEHMSHKVDTVNEQTKNGLKVIKRTAKYMQEVCSCVDTSKDVAKATKDVKLNEVHSDTMVHFSHAAHVMMDGLRDNVVHHQKMIRIVQKSVVEPMHTFYPPKNLNRRHLEKRYQVVMESQKGIEASIEAERTACQKQFEALLDSKRLRNNEEPNSKQFQTQQKKYHKEKAKTIEMFKRFDRRLIQANTARARHLRKDIPEVVLKLESTERERLGLMLKHFTLYMEAQEQYLDALKKQQDILKRAIQQCDMEKQIGECLTTWRGRFGEPPEYAPMQYGLPCTPEDILQNRFGPDYHPGMSPEQSIRRVDEPEYSVSGLDTSRNRFSEFEFGSDRGDRDSKDEFEHLPRCVAIYDFEPKEFEDDAPQLALKKGDVIYITERDDDDENDGWWEGRLGDKVGYFPKEYVQAIKDA